MAIITIDKNPYEFTISDKELYLNIITKKIPSGYFEWPTYEDNLGLVKLQSDLNITIPGGITAIQLSMQVNDSIPVSKVRVLNKESNRYWFDNINSFETTFPIIGVTPKKKYSLTIGSDTNIQKYGRFRLLYSKDINKEKYDTSDL